MLVALFIAASIGAPSEAIASPPIVPAYSQFHAAPKALEPGAILRKSQTDRAAGGRLLLSELGCTACHAPAEIAAAWIERKAAPDLSAVAGRHKPEWLEAYIASPLTTQPGATMPDLLHGYDEGRRKEFAAALAAFLASLLPPVAPDSPEAALAPIGGRQRGANLFANIGCAVCHGERKGENDAKLPAWRPLGDLDAKYTFGGLARFLRDPLACRPAGRMPSFSLSIDEASDLAAHLLPATPEAQGIAFKYYEGSWDRIPNLDELTVIASGAATAIDVAPRQRDDDFALRFEARLSIAADGEFTFHLGSDDGSRLSIDGRAIVEQDHIQGFTWRTEKATLAAGEHFVRIDYFEAQGEERLEAEWEGPGIARRPLAPDLLASSQAKAPVASATIKGVDTALAARGRTLFASLGCAACHAIAERGGAAIASTFAQAPALEAVNVARGCLSKTLKGKSPSYALSANQRADLVAAVASLTDSKATTPGTPERIDAAMERRACYACHERHGKGAGLYGDSSLFTGTQPEMGHEGVAPPPLDGVGAKLTSKWLRKTLAGGAKDRPYMNTRMPGFGEALAQLLAPMLQSHDWTPPLSDEEKSPLAGEDLAAYKLAGWQMVGESGFGCVKCHTFGRFRSTGVQSMNMTTMRDRLREDWFRRYVDNPPAFRRETRMPDAWPKSDGTSLLKNVLDGKNALQIRAVWEFLSDGERARTPTGLAGAPLELVPTTETIIYRNFIEGVGPRGIAVGFPDPVHFAFDAGDCRLALMWQGAFIDASLHWTGRGAGAQKPAGEKLVALPPGASIALLADDGAAWPANDIRFRGYRLTADQRPTFLYESGNFQVEDTPGPAPAASEATLVRTFKVSARDPSAKENGAWLRIAIGDKLSVGADGWCDVDGRYRTRVVGLEGGEPMLRSIDGRQEWIAPLAVDGESAFSQEYQW